MYSRYVDDINLIVLHIYTCITHIASNTHLDTQLKEEQIMATIQYIADSIHSSIQVTVDHTSKHSKNKLSVVVTEMWIEETLINATIQPCLPHSHYYRPNANPQVIYTDSTMLSTTKINIIVVDLELESYGTRPTLCQTQERKHHIQHHILPVQRSGYTQYDRINVNKETQTKFERI